MPVDDSKQPGIALWREFWDIAAEERLHRLIGIVMLL